MLRYYQKGLAASAVRWQLEEKNQVRGAIKHQLARRQSSIGQAQGCR